MNMIRLVNLYSVILLECLVLGHTDDSFSSPQTTVKALQNNTVLLPCYLNTMSTGSDFSNTVRWYHDNELIADNEHEEFYSISDRHIMHSNGSLEIIKVGSNDTGEYMCEVVRIQPWSTVRQFHAIEVLQSPSVEPDPLNRYVKVRLGQQVKFSCKGRGVPYPLITWKRNGEDMQLLDNREMLKFVATNRSLAGYYECVAINGVGEPASAFIQLDIVYPPELTTTTSSWIHTAVGHTVQMDCKVTANPAAHIVWMRKNVLVPYDRRIFRKDYAEGNSILFIKNVQTSDFGTYVCSAMNDEGEQKLYIELSGLPNSVIFKTNAMKQQDSTTSYTLIWEVFSFNPLIEYSLLFREYMPHKDSMRYDWTKLTIPADYSNGIVHTMLYTIKGLKEKTKYEALLLSRNKYGWSKPSSILRFATKGADTKEEDITTLLVTVEPEVTDLVAIDFSSVVSSGSSAHVKYEQFLMAFVVLIVLTNMK